MLLVDSVLSWFELDLDDFSFLCFMLQRYQVDAKVERVDGFALVKEMAEEMQNMMGDKIEAIKVTTTSVIIINLLLCYIISLYY